MKDSIKRITTITILLTIIFQMLAIIIDELNTTVLAIEGPREVVEGTTELSDSTGTTEIEEISTNYEIKEEETWDISTNGDGSVIAKWTFDDRTLTISGTGEMKDWGWTPKGEWNDSQYVYLIENVVIKQGITNIGNNAFYNLSNLTNLQISQGITTIGERAFQSCSSLTSISIPEGTISIGEDAFSGCSNLTSIDIPMSVKTIEDNVTRRCSNLENIVVDENNSFYTSEEGILFNKEKTQLIIYPQGKKDIQEYTIPEGVINIGNDAFSGCSSLSSITIPEGVTSIGNDAFYGCSSLSSISIPESVTSIGYSAFSGCSSLSSITIPEGVTSIDNYAFSGCSSLSNITIPEGVTSIGNYAFLGCSSLSNITIPEGVTSIGNDAFSGCSSLSNITIPEGVTEIGWYAFSGCSSLSSITIPEGVTEIGWYAFSGCSSLASIMIPEGIISIGSKAIPETTIIYTKKNIEGHRYAEENKQGYIIDDVGPEVIIEPNGNTIPQRKYNVKITVQDNIEEVGIKEKSLKYVWSQSETEPENISESFENGQTIEKNTGDGKWYLWISAEDKLGNKTIKRSEYFNFDNTAPNIEVEYSTKEMTKENVIVTLRANEEIQEVEGWTLSQDKKILTKEYRENAQETITIKDLAGNEKQVNIEIKNIIIDIKIGDINNDKKIDITDLLLLKRHIIAGNKTEWQLKGNSLKAANVNEDGNVNITDMLMLKRKLININH